MMQGYKFKEKCVKQLFLIWYKFSDLLNVKSGSKRAGGLFVEQVLNLRISKLMYTILNI